MGECELIAISKTTNGEYIIVTNDNGKVYKHPDQNLFDTDAVGSEIVHCQLPENLHLRDHRSSK